MGGSCIAAGKPGDVNWLGQCVTADGPDTTFCEAFTKKVEALPQEAKTAAFNYFNADSFDAMPAFAFVPGGSRLPTLEPLPGRGVLPFKGQPGESNFKPGPGGSPLWIGAAVATAAVVGGVAYGYCKWEQSRTQPADPNAPDGDSASLRPTASDRPSEAAPATPVAPAAPVKAPAQTPPAESALSAEEIRDVGHQVAKQIDKALQEIRQKSDPTKHDILKFIELSARRAQLENLSVENLSPQDAELLALMYPSLQPVLQATQQLHSDPLRKPTIQAIESFAPWQDDANRRDEVKGLASKRLEDLSAGEIRLLISALEEMQSAQKRRKSPNEKAMAIETRLGQLRVLNAQMMVTAGPNAIDYEDRKIAPLERPIWTPTEQLKFELLTRLLTGADDRKKARLIIDVWSLHVNKRTQADYGRMDPDLIFLAQRLLSKQDPSFDELKAMLEKNVHKLTPSEALMLHDLVQDLQHGVASRASHDAVFSTFGDSSLIELVHAVWTPVEQLHPVVQEHTAPRKKN